MRLPGRVATITGAGAGIGRAAAVMFANEGASVAIVDIDEVGGRETQSILAAAGACVEFFPCDVSNPPAVESTVQLIVDAFGGVDILYNNAGGGAAASSGSVSTVDLEHWWDPFRLDLYGTFLLCRYCIPHLVASGHGAIVNTVSANAFRPPVLLPAYSAAKAGVIAMTKALAVQLGAARCPRQRCLSRVYSDKASVEVCRGSNGTAGRRTREASAGLRRAGGRRCRSAVPRER